MTLNLLGSPRSHFGPCVKSESETFRSLDNKLFPTQLFREEPQTSANDPIPVFCIILTSSACPKEHESTERVSKIRWKRGAFNAIFVDVMREMSSWGEFHLLTTKNNGENPRRGIQVSYMLME